MLAASGLLMASDEMELLRCRKKWNALLERGPESGEHLFRGVMVWLSIVIVGSDGSSILPPAVRLIKCTSCRMSFSPIACNPLGRLQILPLKFYFRLVN